MLIALCDDEKSENEHLAALIDDYAAKRNLDIRCETFTSGEAVLQREKFDLYFLDYFMDEMNGVTLGRRLTEKFNGAVTICYLTNYENAAAEVINNRVYADGFLKKPVDATLLYEKLAFFYKKTFRGRFPLRNGARTDVVYAQDILYAEAQGKKTALHMLTDVREYSYLLSEMEAEFLSGAGFCRIHRSYIVNLQHVESFDAKSVRMKNGETLPLKAKDFKRVYQNYIFDMP